MFEVHWLKLWMMQVECVRLGSQDNFGIRSCGESSVLTMTIDVDVDVEIGVGG